MKYLISLLISLFCLHTAFAADNNSAVGYWKTVDDKTGQVLSIVQIYPVGNVLEGKIVTIMPVLGQKITDICRKCRGELHNQPMLKLRIMWNMEQRTDNVWDHGRVLDPKSGNVYQGKMMLNKDGTQLKLRGYVGIPVFGRSETWIRTDKP